MITKPLVNSKYSKWWMPISQQFFKNVPLITNKTRSCPTVRRPFSPNTQYTAIYFQYMRPKNDNLKMLTKQNKGDPRQEIFSPSLDLVQYFGKILNKSKFNQQTVLASIGGINYVAGKTKL